MSSYSIITSIVDHLINYDVEKVRRLLWAQNHAADHSRREATELMRESVNQFAFRNIDGGKAADPVKTHEKSMGDGDIPSMLKCIDEKSDGASGEHSKESGVQDNRDLLGSDVAGG